MINLFFVRDKFLEKSRKKFKQLIRMVVTKSLKRPTGTINRINIQLLKTYMAIYQSQGIIVMTAFILWMHIWSSSNFQNGHTYILGTKLKLNKHQLKFLWAHRQCSVNSAEKLLHSNGNLVTYFFTHSGWFLKTFLLEFLSSRLFKVHICNISYLKSWNTHKPRSAIYCSI